MGKIGLFGIAGKYIGTLRDYRTGRLMARDIIVQLAFPAVAALAFSAAWPFNAEELSGFTEKVIAGVSIISGLLCGVAVMVFELRLQMASQTDPRPTKRETILVDETFHDIIWATVAGFATVALMTAGDIASFCDVAQRVVYGLAVFFLINFMLVTCMCIKRLSSTYSIVSDGWSK